MKIVVKHKNKGARKLLYDNNAHVLIFPNLRSFGFIWREVSHVLNVKQLLCCCIYYKNFAFFHRVQKGKGINIC